jgi:hypothetical protein
LGKKDLERKGKERIREKDGKEGGGGRDDRRKEAAGIKIGMGGHRTGGGR